MSCQPPEEDESDSNSNQGGTVNGMSYAQAEGLIQGEWYAYKIEIYDAYCSNGEEYMIFQDTRNLANTDHQINFTNEATLPWWGGVFSEYHGDSWVMNGGGGDIDCTYMFYYYSEMNPALEHPLAADQTSSDLYIDFGPINSNNGNEAFWGNISGIFISGGKVVELTAESLVLGLRRIGSNQYFEVHFKRNANQDLPPNSLDLSGTFQIVERQEINSGVLESSETTSNGSIISFNNEIQAYLGTPETIEYLKRRWYKFGTTQLSTNLSLIYLNVQNGYWGTTDSHLILNGISYKVELLNDDFLIIRDYGTCNSYTEYKFVRIS
jgi:hypothetical protein